MEETIDKKIERLLDDEKIKEIIATAGKGEVAPVTRASNLIGEVYTYCFVHNDGEEIEPDSLKAYLERMSNAYFECRGSEDFMQDIRARELGKSIAQRLNIDLSQGSISREDEIKIQEYFLKNYVENGYVMHSFPGATEQSIRTYGFSSSERIWDNKEIMEIAHIFEEKNVIAPVGAYSHYSGGGMYVENNPRQMYWHGLSAPEWFKWFTSANHNRNSSKIDESPYYLRNYDGCKQNVMDLCNNAELNEEEMQKVMEMFEKNWKLLGTERMCVSLIPKSVIGKANIEDAIIPGQSAIETIKTVLTDGRKQFKEHEGNVLKTTVTEKDMLIMGLPNASEIFGKHEFSRETKEKLYDPKQVLDLIYRGTKESGFELSQDKINSIIETLREVHNNSPEVEDIIQQYNQRVALFSEQEIGKTTINSPTKLKDNAMSRVQRQQQELIQTQENQETLE